MNHHAGCRHALLVAAALTFGCSDSTPTPPSKNCQYTVTPVQVNPCMPATQFSSTVTTQSGCTWTAAAGASWISIVSGSSGSGSGTVTFAVTANYDAPRTGTVAVRWPNTTTGQDVQVSQGGCSYFITQTSFPSPFGAAGGPGSFFVMQQPSPNECGGPLQTGCVWSAQSSVSWIRVTSSMPRSDDNIVNFTVDPNPTGATRSGTITVRDKVVQVTQAG